MTRGLRVGLLLAVVAGAGLRVLNLGAESLWVDEAWSIQAASQPVGEIAGWTAKDVHPPFYYWLLHFWLTLTGPSEVGARLLSALVSTLTILALYRLAARLFGPPTGLVAAVLLAVSPFHLAAAQEARMYALLTLLSVVSMDCFLRLIDAAPGRRLFLTASYIVVTTLALYTHAYGFFVVLTQVVWLGVVVFKSAPGTVPSWKPAAAAIVVAGLLFAPWLPVFLTQLSDVQQRFWLPPAPLKELAIGLAFHAGAPYVALVILPLAAVGLASRESRHHLGFLAVWVGYLLLLPFAISRVGPSIFAIKYGIAASPALLVLAARGLLTVPVAAKMVAFVVFVWLLNGTLVRDYTVLDKDDWRGVAAHVETRARAGDVVLFHQPYGQIPFDYYTSRSDLVERKFLKTQGDLTVDDVRRALRATVGSAARVWLVLSTADAVTPLIPRELQTSYDIAEHVRNQGIETYLFVARKTTSGIVSRSP